MSEAQLGAWRWWGVGLALVLAALTGGCSVSYDAVEAGERLVARIDATAANLEHDGEVERRLAPLISCREGGDDYEADMSLLLALPEGSDADAALDAVVAYWRAQDLEVTLDRPEAFTTDADGFGYRAATTADGQLRVAGNTRCWPLPTGMRIPEAREQTDEDLRFHDPGDEVWEAG